MIASFNWELIVLKIFKIEDSARGTAADGDIADDQPWMMPRVSCSSFLSLEMANNFNELDILSRWQRYSTADTAFIYSRRVARKQLFNVLSTAWECKPKGVVGVSIFT